MDHILWPGRSLAQLNMMVGGAQVATAAREVIGSFSPGTVATPRLDARAREAGK